MVLISYFYETYNLLLLKFLIFKKNFLSVPIHNKVNSKPFCISTSAYTAVLVRVLIDTREEAIRNPNLIFKKIVLIIV